MNFIYHAKPKKDGNGFTFESESQKIRVLSFLQSQEGRELRFEVSHKKQSKTEQQLGYYWGALLPCGVAHNKDLTFDPLYISELVKRKNISHVEIDDWHKSLMLEFRPSIAYDLEGTPHKQAGEMKKMFKNDVVTYLAEVIEYYNDNGIPVPHSEEYKAILDEAIMLHDKSTR